MTRSESARSAPGWAAPIRRRGPVNESLRYYDLPGSPWLDERMPIWRAQRFLESLQAVYQERACLSEVGAAYLGVKFRLA